MMRRRVAMRTVVPVLLALAAAACASAPGDSVRTDTRVLSAEEMERSGYTEAFSAVQALRPQWLRLRGSTTFTGTEGVKVYLDSSLMGGPEQLRTVSVHSIAMLRYLDGREATNRWGLDHGMGAIVIVTRNR
jgi:hypothetical protein